MKDFSVVKTARCFEDLDYDITSDHKVVFRSVEHEKKLLQSLTKLILTPETEHPLGYGADHDSFDETEISRIFDLYTTTNKSPDPSEIIEEASIKRTAFRAFEIELVTRKQTRLKFVAGE